MRVIVTRPQNEARPWVQQLKQAGFDAVAVPLIEVVGTPDMQAVYHAWQTIADFDAIMFVSGNAVDYFFASRPVNVPELDSGALHPRMWVTGPGSYAALTLRAGIKAQYIDAPDAQSGQFDSEALWSVVSAQFKRGAKVLVVRGGSCKHSTANAQGFGREWLARQIGLAGGEVSQVLVYQRTCPDFTCEQQAVVHSAAADGSVSLSSSSEALENLKATFPVQQWEHANAIVTHARIGSAASQMGFGTVLESRPVLADIMACLQTLQ